tara:strand:- start:2236 stop:3540 length:1305 start_codon:yes stop_codon:yes gene_type:complete
MNKKQNTILIIDDEPEIRGLMQDILTDEGYLTFSAKNANEANILIDDIHPDLVYLDIWMPEMDGISLLEEWSSSKKLNFPVIMISGHATIETAVEATRLGAFDFIEKPLSIEKLVVSAEKALSASIKSAKKNVVLLLKNNCSAYKDIFSALDAQANDNETLFLDGEIGTEKEEFAKYIHYQAQKTEENFVSVQLNLLTPDQHENEVISSELNKITNNRKHTTIFLSGYSKLKSKNQKEVQNFLQKGLLGQEIKFIVGINHNKTDKKLKKNEELSILFSEATFIELLPLRQCLQDIPELLKGFIDYFGVTEGLIQRRFSLAAQNILTQYAWPGNLKQLKNMVHATLLRPDKEIVNIEEIEETLTLQGPGGDLLVQKDILSMTMTEAKEQFEKAFLSRQLELVGGRVTELARRVDMERTNLYRKLSSLDINYKKKK